MTKSEMKILEKRLTKLDGKTSSTDDGGGARMAWLIHHLTEDERNEGATYIKRLDETDQKDKDAEERLGILLGKAQIRGDLRPAIVREEFYQKHSRAEELRNMRYPLTDMEREELAALNDWFDKFRRTTFEQQLETGRKELESDAGLRQREGLDRNESYADERGGE